MTQHEIDLLFAYDEKVRKRNLEKANRPKSLDNKGTKIVTFTVNESVYEVFREHVKDDGLTIPAVLRAAVLGYSFGELTFSEGKLKSSNEILLNTPEGFNILHNSIVPREKNKPGRPPVVKEPTKEKLPFVHWIDQDHTTRELKDFDYPDNVHIHGDARPMLELTTFGTVTKEDYEDLLMKEYLDYRKYFSDRAWELEYWNFCRYCAKKFMTLNKNLEYRYEESYLQKGLYAVQDLKEPEFLTMREAGVFEKTAE